MAKKIYLDGKDIKFIDGVQTTARTLTQLAQGYIDGWLPAGETWTYASATTFTISGDKTGKYQIGDKIKLTQTTAKYFSVIEVSYSDPNTTITITGGTDYTLADATITNPFYSKIENPQGFSHWFNWTPTITYAGGTTDPTSNTINEAMFKINGKEVKFYLKSTLVRGSGNRTWIKYSLPITFAVPADTVLYGRETTVTTTPVVRGCQTGTGENTVTIALVSAMANDGIISIAGFYRIA